MLYASVAALIVVIDQYVKYWVSNNIGLGGEDVRTIIPGILGLVNIRNDGAAFGFLSGGRIWFILIAGVLLVVAIILLATKAIKNPAARWALVMITAGGVGNAIDRVINGYVQDMFKTLFTDFAIFNVADIFITVGGILFIICIIFGRDPNKEERSVRRSRRLRDEEEDEDEEDEDEEDEPRHPSRAERRAARKAAREAEEEDDDEDEDEEEEEKPRKRSLLKKSRRDEEEEDDDEDEDDEEEEEELLRRKRRAERDAKIEKLKAERLRRQREAEEEDDEEELELPRRRKVSSAEAAPAKKAPRKDAFTEVEERSKAAGSYTRYGKGVEVKSSGIKDVDVSDKFRNLREPSPEKAAPAKAATAAERKAAPASDKAAVQAAAAAALAANARKSAPKAAEKPPVKSSDDEFDLDSILAEFK
jgi:signal peptidase II